MTPHFFKARSRIGLINNPNHQAESNNGVEAGCDVILDNRFLTEVKDYKVSEFSFPFPEDIQKDKFYGVLRDKLAQFRDLIIQEMKLGEQQVVVGGDHCVTLPSVLALIERAGDAEKIGYVHFDSHGDINQYADSPSKNFHGMYLRPLFDTFDVTEIDNLVPQKIPSENAFFIGNLDLDAGEKVFFEMHKVKSVSKQDVRSDQERVLTAFKSFIDRFDYLHVSFDVDVLDKSIFPSTGIPAESGFMMKDILPFLETMKKHKNFSFDISEYNPRKTEAEESKKIAQEIVSAVLQ